MTNDTSIKPALTPDEWYQLRRERGVYSYVLIDGAELVIGDGGDCCGIVDDDTLRAIIALANHALPADDPRKITRADVRFLRSVLAATWGGERAGYVKCKNDQSGLDALAAKLEALLPPE